MTEARPPIPQGPQRLFALPRIPPVAKAAAPPVTRESVFRRGLVLWLGVSVFLVGLAALDTLFEIDELATYVSYRIEDLPILLVLGFAACVLIAAPGLAHGIADGLQGAARVIDPILIWVARRPPWALAMLMAAACTLAAICGTYLVFQGYAFSIDEFMATFDAEIFRHGTPIALIPSRWRAYAPALQPLFILPTLGGTRWVSTYLPVNAAFLALGKLAGAETLVSAMWAGTSVIAVFAVARRLWPDRPGRALIAAGLLATSSQFLITAMTEFAMPAHLALNLVWLWLFLRGGKIGNAGAIAVAFLACGLHQLIFHPLFAAPFILQLWLDRRWRTGALYTGAYAAIGLFWAFYWSFALHWVGGASQSASAVGGSYFASRAIAVVTAFDPMTFGLMAKNLIRLMTWQNLLTVPLALPVAGAALRAKGNLRALLLGLILTIVAMFVLMPFQGYGWGYRYLHGFLGSLCLLAAWGWSRLTDDLTASEGRVARAGFVAAAIVALLVLGPIRAWQAHSWVRPYAAASAAISHARTQLVFVDRTGIGYGRHLVRNDPYLRNWPKVMSLDVLDEAGVRDLCSRYSVSIFDQTDATRFGVPTIYEPQTKQAKAMRILMTRISCGRGHV